jgi:hypothetical protein
MQAHQTHFLQPCVHTTATVPRRLCQRNTMRETYTIITCMHVAVLHVQGYQHLRRRNLRHLVRHVSPGTTSIAGQHATPAQHAWQQCQPACMAATATSMPAGRQGYHALHLCRTGQQPQHTKQYRGHSIVSTACRTADTAHAKQDSRSQQIQLSDCSVQQSQESQHSMQGRRRSQHSTAWHAGQQAR